MATKQSKLSSNNESNSRSKSESKEKANKTNSRQNSYDASPSQDSDTINGLPNIRVEKTIEEQKTQPVPTKTLVVTGKSKGKQSKLKIDNQNDSQNENLNSKTSLTKSELDQNDPITEEHKTQVNSSRKIVKIGKSKNLNTNSIPNPDSQGDFEPHDGSDIDTKVETLEKIK